MKYYYVQLHFHHCSQFQLLKFKMKNINANKKLKEN
jgi:hypothetical protein